MIFLWVRRKLNKDLSPLVTHLQFSKARKHQGMIDAWNSLVGFDASKYVNMDSKVFSIDSRAMTSGEIMYILQPASRMEILARFIEENNV